MMNFRVGDWREKRNILNNHVSFVPMQYTIANYSTEARIDKKTDLESFNEHIMSKISSIPDPLKKNLADTVITSDQNKETKKMPPEVPNLQFNQLPEEKNSSSNHRSDFYQSITGITSFFTSVFGAISGAVFHRRSNSPVSQYYDCYDSDSELAQQMAAESWPAAKIADQNKKRAEPFSADANDKMNNCRAAAAHCEGKLNAVKSLLDTKTVCSTPKLRPRRPKRVFVEPNSIADSYEEDFDSEQYTSLANEEYVEYFAKPNNQNQVFSEIDAANMKTELKPLLESTDIVKVLPEVNNKESVIEKPENQIKREVISSCEDKMAKLKLLLQEKRQKSNLNDSTDSLMEPVKEQPRKPTNVIPIEKIQDKKFKNPCRLVEKRNKTRMKKNIQDDMAFANEIDNDDISSVEHSPVISNLQKVAETIQIGSVESVDYFDELKGRFHSASTTDSDDSFQIVFTDSPRPSRVCRPSECDSEDSFIIFEDSPDSCYTSNDVFNDSDDNSDNESVVSDSGCALNVCRLSHNLSRTVSDLTDDSLYIDSVPTKFNPSDDEISNNGEESVQNNDEVDCAVQTFDHITESDISAPLRPSLVNEAKKKLKKSQSPKKVSFSEKPPQVRVMRVWAYAARQARAGHWERHALDRERFKRRIADVDMAVSWVLKPQHRSRVMFQRFMPWWNQQKRKEAAEKKLRVEEEKQRVEDEKQMVEERKLEIERRKEDSAIEEVSGRKVDDGYGSKTVKVERIKDSRKVSKAVELQRRFLKSVRMGESGQESRRVLLEKKRVEVESINQTDTNYKIQDKGNIVNQSNKYEEGEMPKDHIKTEENGKTSEDNKRIKEIQMVEKENEKRIEGTGRIDDKSKTKNENITNEIKTCNNHVKQEFKTVDSVKHNMKQVIQNEKVIDENRNGKQIDLNSKNCIENPECVKILHDNDLKIDFKVQENIVS